MSKMHVAAAFAVASTLVPSSRAQTEQLWRTVIDFPASEVFPRGAHVADDGRSRWFGWRRGGTTWGLQFGAQRPDGTSEWSLFHATAGSIALDGAYADDGTAYVLSGVLSGPLPTATVSRVGPDGTWNWDADIPDVLMNSPGTPRIQRAPDGMLHVLVSRGVGLNDVELQVVRISPAGAIVGQTSIPADGIYAWANTLRLDASGGAFVSGWTESTSGGSSAVLLARIAPDGTLAWRSEIPSSVENAKPTAAALDAAGNAYVAIAVDVPTASWNWLVRSYDPAGGLRWSQTVVPAGSFQTLPIQVLVDARGDVLSVGVHDGRMRLVKLDAQGAVLWTRSDELAPPAEAVNVHTLFTLPDESVTVGWVRQVNLTLTSIVSRFDRTGLPQAVETYPTSTASYAVAPETAGARGLYWGSTISPQPFVQDLILARRELHATPVCFGDGSGAGCPCANHSGPHDHSGCLNSTGSGGRLFASGEARLSSPTLALHADGLTSGTALFLQGTRLLSGGAGAAFGDGLGCVEGKIVRLGAVLPQAGAAQFPSSTSTSIPVLGGIGAPGSRTYQAWYRNAASFCTPSAFSLTNALVVRWAP